MAQAIEEVLGDPESKRLASDRGEALKKQLCPGAVAAVFENVYRQALSSA
jgi:UDP:flavonoid glycosyltransferase YjiC (YdhE family)